MADANLLSLVPPVLTIVLAIWTRNIIVSLVLGVLCGSLILTGFNPFAATIDMIEQRIFVQIAVPSNIQIIFTMMAIGGFIRLLEESGGASAFARSMVRFVTTRRRAELLSFSSGLAIFFTDTGNALINGPLYRPIFARLGICREKLAYILDSTASPICILIPFIGWGAYIMGLIEQSYADAGLTASSFDVLIAVLPNQFYAILALFSVFIFAMRGRDFGAMRTAQQAMPAPEPATPAAGLPMDEAVPLRLFVVPIVTLLGLIAGLLTWYSLNDDLTSTHVRSTLTIAYVAASLACALLTLGRGVTFNDSLGRFVKGCETMVTVVIILILAWSLSSVIRDLDTAGTIATLVRDDLAGAALPALVFVLGAIISIATGSSWGTFAILLALAVPVAVAIDAPLILTIAAVLSGGLFGDHTSPISDTTVLASIGADCPHIDHVTTQFSYALVTGGFAFAAYLGAGFYPGPAWLPLAAVGLALAIFFLTRSGIEAPRTSGSTG